MADETASGWPGIIAGVGSAIVTAIVGGLAFWTKIVDARRDRATESATAKMRADLDEHTRNYQDRLERRLIAAEARADRWEASARRADSIAHQYKHEVNNWRAKNGIAEVAEVPLLEDPVETESKPK